MRSCNEHTTMHCVQSYLYYIILVKKTNIFGGVNLKRQKIIKEKESKDCLARNQYNVSEWGDMFTRGLLFHRASTIKIQLFTKRVGLNLISISFNINTCCVGVKNNHSLVYYRDIYKVRNEIETKRNEMKSTKTKRNETKSTKTKRNEINEMKTK